MRTFWQRLCIITCSQTSLETHHCVLTPGWSWWAPGPLCCRIVLVPVSAVAVVTLNSHSGNTSNRSRISACRRRTARPSAVRKPDSNRNPVLWQSRKKWWAWDTPPGAPRCSSGSGTRSPRPSRAGATNCRAMHKTYRYLKDLTDVGILQATSGGKVKVRLGTGEVRRRALLGPICCHVTPKWHHVKS